MKYPENIKGPRFDEGDLVTFTFDGAELTLRLPVVPANRNNRDRVSPIVDFRGINTDDWETDIQEVASTVLANQAWHFEDAISLDNIAKFALNISLVEISQQQAEQNTLLDTQSFEQAMLDLHSYFSEDDETKLLNDPSWPAPSNRFRGKSIAKEHLNWFSIEFCTMDGSKPDPMAMIPINNRFFVVVSTRLISLHYPDRKNPYSDETLRKFQFDLFDEILSHIGLHYTPETIAAIQNCKKKGNH